jgi:aminoglycoside phosphotransferase family enzyme
MSTPMLEQPSSDVLPAGLPLDLPPAEIETHVSQLHLVGDLVFKVKKPVRMEFLDFSTLEQRELACRREVELNRRLAPDVYLGVAHLSSSPGAEPVVVMRRQPADRSLAELATNGADLRAPLAEVAAALARFHREAPHSRRISGAASADAVLSRWDDNMAQLRRALPAGFDAAEVDELAAAGRRFVTGRGKLFRERIRTRRVCDGHGDLLASDVFCPTGGPPQILDCLEFDDGLRYGDALADVAFLAMDLERLGRLDGAEQLLTAYRSAADDEWPASLAHFYIAHRAAIRAKVACLRTDPAARHDLRAHLDLMRRHLQLATVRLVLVGGPPGSGKTTLAASLAGAAGWDLLCSDVVRKRLAGLPMTVSAAAAYREGLYAPTRTAQAYQALLHLAAAQLARGHSVVLDATWASPTHRRWAQRQATRSGAVLVELEAAAPQEVAEVRLRARAAGPAGASDADVEIARRIRERFAPWTTARRVDTTQPPREAAAATLAALVDPHAPL